MYKIHRFEVGLALLSAGDDKILAHRFRGEKWKSGPPGSVGLLDEAEIILLSDLEASALLEETGIL